MRHLNGRNLFLTCLVLSLVLLGVGVWSGFQKLGWLTLDDDTHFQIENGAVVLRHIYTVGETVSEERYLSEPIYRSDMPPAPTPWEFSFTSGNNIGLSGNGIVSPAKHWLLRFPLALVTALVFLAWTPSLLWRLRRRPAPLPRTAAPDVVERPQSAAGGGSLGMSAAVA